MESQRLKGLVRGWKNEINRLERIKTKTKISNLEISTIIETLNRCISDIETLILLKD